MTHVVKPCQVDTFVRQGFTRSEALQIQDIALEITRSAMNEMVNSTLQVVQGLNRRSGRLVVYRFVHRVCVDG